MYEESRQWYSGTGVGDEGGTRGWWYQGSIRGWYTRVDTSGWFGAHLEAVQRDRARVALGQHRRSGDDVRCSRQPEAARQVAVGCCKPAVNSRGGTA